MIRKNIICFSKKLTAGVLAVAVVAAGLFAVPKQVDAAVAADQVKYVKYDDISSYRGEIKTAPVLKGYVFGGWYDSEDGNYYDQAGADSLSNGAYAKFVPAQVLSVKAQNIDGTDKNSNTTSVRVISSLDSTKYQKVGFDIWLSNQKQLHMAGTESDPLETTKVYSGLNVGTDNWTANQVFGGISQYVSVWELINVANKNFGEIIYVRPYWITMDGTKVEGLAKYVHIEDGYKDGGYISVPVNLMTGEDVAAGAVNVSYPEGAELVGVENGRLFAEMISNTSTTGTIEMVGNTEDATDVKADGIYANLRFKKSSITTATKFTVTKSKFCNNAETRLDSVKAWDTAYIPITTGQ